MKWIPMTEHKPPKKGRYLVTLDSEAIELSVDIDDWDDLGEFFEIFEGNVTALAELPKPYEGK